MYLNLIKTKKINFSKMRSDIMLCLTCKKNNEDKNIIMLKIINHIDNILYNIMKKNRENTVQSLTRLIKILEKLPETFFNDCTEIKKQMLYFKEKYNIDKKEEIIVMKNFKIEEEYFNKINKFMDKKQNK